MGLSRPENPASATLFLIQLSLWVLLTLIFCSVCLALISDFVFYGMHHSLILSPQLLPLGHCVQPLLYCFLLVWILLVVYGVCVAYLVGISMYSKYLGFLHHLNVFISSLVMLPFPLSFSSKYWSAVTVAVFTCLTFLTIISGNVIVVTM